MWVSLNASCIPDIGYHRANQTGSIFWTVLFISVEKCLYFSYNCYFSKKHGYFRSSLSTSKTINTQREVILKLLKTVQSFRISPVMVRLSFFPNAYFTVNPKAIIYLLCLSAQFHCYPRWEHTHHHTSMLARRGTAGKAPYPLGEELRGCELHWVCTPSRAAKGALSTAAFSPLTTRHICDDTSPMFPTCL